MHGLQKIGCSLVEIVTSDGPGSSISAHGA